MVASKFIEEHKVVNCGNSSFIAANEDIFNGNPATDVVNLSQWEEITFIIQKGAGATGTATITVESCDDTTPTTSTAVAFRYRLCTSGDTFGAWTAVASTGFTTTAGANQVYEVNIRASELSTTDKYVRMQCTEVANSPCDGGICAILTGPRYAEDINATVLT